MERRPDDAGRGAAGHDELIMHAAATLLVSVAAVAAGLLLPAATPGSPDRDAGLVQLAMPDGGSLQVSRFEVTRGEWQACHAAGGCSLAAPESGASLPMTGVNFFDAQEYLAWINAQTGGRYRLPTKAEWQAFAQELPQPAYKKLFSDPRLAWAADYNAMPAVPTRLRPSGGFGTFRNGLSDLAGNVWEWTASCASPGFEMADCPAPVVEGQHEAAVSVFIRDPATGGCAAGTPPAHLGFRLVRD
jgi:formylglycine-generating enzyme required for sulfatase activity